MGGALAGGAGRPRRAQWLAVRRRRGPDRSLSMGGYRQRLGASGEARAREWYEAAGYEVLDRNWRCREGEIDLVCRRGATVVVCEVKTRSSAAFGHPAEAVTPAKQRRLRGLSARWLREHGVRCRQVRFDVAAVTADRVEVLEAAF